jgi:hypothetical protein
MISCERNYGEVKQSFCFTGNALRSVCARSTEADSLACGQVFALPIPNREESNDTSSPLVVKVVSRDAHGRRSTAWLTIAEEPMPMRLTELPKTSTNR